jgi:acyl carrier protein
VKVRRLTVPTLLYDRPALYQPHTGSGGMNDILPRLQEVLADLVERPPEALTEEQRFIDDLECDSLDLINVVAEIEQEFGIPLTDDDAEQLLTIGDGVRIVRRKLLV